jgi:hypothetical protein
MYPDIFAQFAAIFHIRTACGGATAKITGQAADILLGQRALETGEQAISVDYF